VLGPAEDAGRGQPGVRNSDGVGDTGRREQKGEMMDGKEDRSRQGNCQEMEQDGERHVCFCLFHPKVHF
jgi:hypothetical protein